MKAKLHDFINSDYGRVKYKLWRNNTLYAEDTYCITQHEKKYLFTKVVYK